MEIVSQESLPEQQRSPESQLKMHLRLLTIGGTTYRIVTLRPGTKICFSTNFYHQTWHIVTSQSGSRLLARLLWGLSYEQHPGTLLLIHDDHLLPTPFEAERSDPILIAPTGITPLDSAAFRLLKGRLRRLGPPTRTIRWQSFGLDAALQADPEDQPAIKKEGDWLRRKENRQLWRQERMQRLGGFLVYSAPPPILRLQALRIHGLNVQKASRGSAMDYHFLAECTSRDSWCDGEVQIFADYMDRVAAAVQAREELLANPRQPVLSETVQEDISRRRDQIKFQRVRGKRRFGLQE
jgi:hypothetical protein